MISMEKFKDLFEQAVCDFVIFNRVNAAAALARYTASKEAILAAYEQAVTEKNVAAQDRIRELEKIIEGYRRDILLAQTQRDFWINADRISERGRDEALAECTALADKIEELEAILEVETRSLWPPFLIGARRQQGAWYSKAVLHGQQMEEERDEARAECTRLADIIDDMSSVHTREMVDLHQQIAVLVEGSCSCNTTDALRRQNLALQKQLETARINLSQSESNNGELMRMIDGYKNACKVYTERIHEAARDLDLEIRCDGIPF